MSDYSSMATLQNNSQPAGFAAALQRAKLVAAKIEGGGSKRPLEDGTEPSAKKLASVDPAYQQQHAAMSASNSAAAVAAAAAAAAAARISAANPAPPAPAPPGMMQDQTLNEYIRVPDKMVGLIIGRGGEQITRLQAESGCKIQMAPGSGGQPDRVCTLTGSREAINRARNLLMAVTAYQDEMTERSSLEVGGVGPPRRELVNQIVNHRGRENAPQHQDGPGMGMGGGDMGNPPMQRGGGGGGGLAVTEEIMLPGPKVGLIIGKNGKTIKQLQEQSGAKMVVIQDGPNTEYEKPLRISGDPSKVEHAKQLVFELLADKDAGGGGGGGGGRQYDDVYSPQDQGGNHMSNNSTEVLVPKIAVGVVIGRGGDMIKKIQAETGCRVQFHQERDDGPGDKRCYLQGKPHQVDQARQMIEDLIASVNRRDQEVRSGRGRGGSGQRNGDRGDFQQWQDNQEIRVTFTVSNLKCGLIIGRGGEVIKQINAQSGAHCELDRRAQGADRNNRTFYIRGHPDAVEHCKRIIMEKVGMPVNFIPEGGNGGGSNNGNGNGGGGGGGGGDYYGGGGGGQGAAWGYNPHWHQPNANQPPQQQQVNINPATGQPDYSQQWIDYYRSLGLVREAEAIEQQAKQQQQGGPGNGAGGAPGGGGGGGAAPSPAPAAAPGADYSAQWAEYYRSIGKLKEAEAIEQQIKLKGAGGGAPAGGAAGGAGGGAPAPAATPPAAVLGAQYAAPQYPVYPGQVYPPYQPYQYPQQPDHQQ